MKKILMSLVFCFSAFLHSEKNLKFSDLLCEESGTELMGLISWKTLRFRSFLELEKIKKNQLQPEQLTVNQRVSAMFRNAPFYLQCLRDKEMISLKETDEGTLLFCSRNGKNLDEITHELCKAEQDRYKSYGWKLKKNSVSVFSLTDKSANFVRLSDDGTTVQKSRVRINPDETFGISIPSKVLVLKIDEKSQVSDEELGVVALQMLRSDKNLEIHADGYSIKLTILTKEIAAKLTAPLNIQDLYPQQPGQNN